ncbi:active breakpoint cluster region-related protein-like isoform X3 [Lytechinus variegatus]|uniref:active breakpoint cluster region-related protein-like isoform X3 n=1 Tax=Lytechinus variegatus TaxID=7654 RepID=UPI001BB0FDAB|nr:active breakpoint cluster region-related protein-like isoform X3 [Lytechinus variegatus]
MTIKDAFMESWRRNFGEFPPPGLMFLLETTAAEVLSGGKRHLSDIQLLEDDMKLCKSRIFKLRSEIRREKYCQSWIAKEIIKRRRADEGLESVGSDETNSIDLDSEDGLKSGEESHDDDADMIEDENLDESCEIPDIPTIMPVVPPRPVRSNTLTQQSITRTPFPTNDDDSDSSGDDYENVAFILANRESVRSLSPCTPESRGSDTDYNNDEGGVVRSGSFGSSLEDVNITTEKKLHILSSRAGSYLPESPSVSVPQSPITDFDKFSEQGYESSSTTEDVLLSAGETRPDFGALSSDSVSLSPSVDSVEDKDVDPAVIRPNDINITLTDNGQHNPSLDSPHSATTPSRNDSIKLSTPEVEKLSIRRLLLGGILESEQKYIKSLEILQKVMKTFKASISTSTPVMTEEEYDTMFFRIPELLNVHRQFVHHMEPKMEHWTPEQMQGDSFKLLASHFDIHEEYIANYKRAMSTLQRLQTENELFRNIAQQALKLESGEMYTLEAMLYSPLQGITKLTMILNDLLKHTPEHHEDHSILSQVLEKTRKFFKQVDDATREIHSTKQKRELIRQGYLVEWTEGGRKLRRILLWSDLIICASKRNTSGMFQRDKGQYDFQWYIPLTELSLTPNDRCEAEPHVVAKSDSELRQMKKDISELQEKIKRDKAAKQSRAIQKSIDQKRKQIGELEVGYVLESPKLPFHLYHHSGKTYTILMSSDYERSDWKEAILTTKRECRMTPSITPYHISNSVLIPKTRRGRDSYVNISSVLLKDNDELLTGMLYVTVKEARGLTVPSQLYCCLETDAYGIFSRMAKTRKTSNTIKPKWNEEFALDVDGAKTLRILCYDFTKGLDDEMYDKGAVSLAKQEISVTGGKDFTILMDQLQVDVTVRFESSEKTLKRVHSRKKMGVFGVQVGTLAHRQGKNIPNIITLCVEEVDRRGIHEMGIYRISGSSADIQKLKKAFEITFHDLCEITESDRRNIASMLKQSDIHAVAGLLKAYLRELPEPLFTHALYPQFVDGLQLTDPVAKKKCFMSLLKSVVEPNRTIIFLLFNHLRRIAKEEEKNKMSLHNLSTVFGPTLLGPAATTNASGKPDILAEIMGMSSVISQVGILHYCLEHFSDTTELLETDL